MILLAPAGTTRPRDVAVTTATRSRARLDPESLIIVKATSDNNQSERDHPAGKYPDAKTVHRYPFVSMKSNEN